MDRTKRPKKPALLARIVGGIVLTLGLMLAGLVILQPKRRRILVQYV
ncbi:MAG: hypothetical protein JW918_14090 [Anaerolineae bacterium]|nr:hypothetical protein [Anaerolineae bacterium]